MALVRVCLFGKFRVEGVDGGAVNVEGRKLQELLAYLLLYRHKPHSRETLASLFWPNYSTARSKQYLRQSLWLIQGALGASQPPMSAAIVVVDDEWVQVNPESNYWLDVAAFESVSDHYRQLPTSQLAGPDLQALRAAAEVYTGDLLEGSYSDWCLFERERLQNQFLGLLHKLLEGCEAQREYELGLVYGAAILQRDPAHERAHHQVMRLYWLSGRRTEALRQYHRCEQALKQELGVRPSWPTRALYDEISADGHVPAAATQAGPGHSAPLGDMLSRLHELQWTLQGIQRRVEDEIHALEGLLTHGPASADAAAGLGRLRSSTTPSPPIDAE
jgi:DNA-binding SARP family transcriptional activator